MFRPKKHIKLNPLASVPELDHLQRALAEAQKNRGITVELPWRLKDANLYYSLTVRAELSDLESVWTLYEGEDKKSHVIWSAPFTDLELLKEVVSLTVAEATGLSYTNLPAQSPALLAAQERWQEAAEVTKKVVESSSQIELPQPAVSPIPVAPPPPVYFYPGYPYPIPYPYPYPPVLPDPNALAAAHQSVPELSVQNPELFSKKKNFLLGQFFVGAGLIAQATLNIILKLQEMTAKGLLSTEQVVEAIKKAHSHAGNVDMAALIKDYVIASSAEKNENHRKNAPLLGEILIRAEVINNSLLLAVLKLQEVVRSGAMTEEEACQALKKELTGSKSKGPISLWTPVQEQTVLELLIKAGLISQEDKTIASGVQRKHGGRIDNILVAAGKVSKKTFAAALECEDLLSQKKIKLEQVMIALNYCERSRVGLGEAIADLGWLHDLDL